MTLPEHTQPHGTSPAVAELANVLEAYLAELQAGQAPDRAALLAAHPDIAGQLDSCLAALEFIHRAGTPAGAVPTSLGDFRIVREIGRGGMGVVYEAEQISLRRRVALKVLRFGGPADPEALARFRREAELVARLHHTNIVPVFAFGCEQGVHYYAMQLIDGQSLAAALAAGAGPRDPVEVAGWGLHAAEALAYAHARGIVHRDVKPSNLLLDPEGTVWLTDFGLARPAEETVLTAAGVPLGTPRYMSPEQVAAVQPVDVRSDVYSLGATLYELATGRPAFDAEGVAQLLASIRDHDPVPPRRHRPDLPRDLETIILRCLHKQPEQRYSSAQDLADDLRAFREGRPIRARRPSLIEKTQRWLAVRRFNAAAVASGMVVTALAIVWIILFVRDGGWRGHADLGFDLNRQVQRTSDRLTGTFDAPLTAEILGEGSDEAIVPPFTIPTTRLVRIPGGRHRLRLSYPGGLSACYPLDLSEVGLGTWRLEHRPVLPFDARGGKLPREGKDALSFPVHDLWLDPPAKVLLWKGVPTERGHDVIVLEPGVVSRLAGADGKTLWRTPLEGKASTLLRATREAMPCLERLGDCLVWADAGTPTLLGLSARTGEVLWILRAPVAEPGGAGVMGQSIVVAAGDPNEPLLVAVARSVGPPEACELMAVTAAGRIVWRYALPANVQPPRRRFEELPALTAARVRGQSIVVCLAGGCLIGIDVRTGQPAWPVRPLGFRPVHPPRFADLDGDGSTDALLVRSSGPGELTFTAIDLATGRTLWEHAGPGWPEGRDPSETANLEQEEPDWPLVADLDGDGYPEILVRRAWFDPEPPRPRMQQNWRPIIERVGLALLDGRTGQLRWERRLGRSRHPFWSRAHPVRLLVGPDLDGDGTRELFVASVLASQAKQLPPVELYVDAISGSTGTSQWWYRRALLGTINWWWGKVEQLVCWPGNRGQAPLLIVPLGAGYTGGPTVSAETMALALDGCTGHLRHLVPALDRPAVVDLDGDGLPDLVGRNMAQTRGVAASLQVLCGTAPTVSARVAGQEEMMANEVDPRATVPLPWTRHGSLAEISWREALSKLLLVILPVVLVFALLGWAGDALRRRFAPRLAGEQNASQEHRDKQTLRVGTLITLLATGFVGVFLAGALWIWLVSGELAPGETYCWEGWLWHWLRAGSLAGVGLMVVGGSIIRDWRSGK